MQSLTSGRGVRKGLILISVSYTLRPWSPNPRVTPIVAIRRACNITTIVLYNPCLSENIYRPNIINVRFTNDCSLHPQPMLCVTKVEITYLCVPPHVSPPSSPPSEPPSRSLPPSLPRSDNGWSDLLSTCTSRLNLLTYTAPDDDIFNLCPLRKGLFKL